MLYVDGVTPDQEEPSFVLDTAEVRARLGTSALRGAVDVVGMRGFVRVFKDLRNARPPDDEFDRALIKMINQNGALARALLNAKQQP